MRQQWPTHHVRIRGTPNVYTESHYSESHSLSLLPPSPFTIQLQHVVRYSLSSCSKPIINFELTGSSSGSHPRRAASQAGSRLKSTIRDLFRKSNSSISNGNSDSESTSLSKSLRKRFSKRTAKSVFSLASQANGLRQYSADLGLDPQLELQPGAEGASSRSPAPAAIVVFSVLGVVGPIDHKDVGWMVADSLLFTTLLAAHPGFDGSRFRYRSIREVEAVFPRGTFLFGEAGCDRLRFRVPDCVLAEKNQQGEHLNADDFVEDVIHDLRASASQVKAGEKFVLILVEHGELERKDTNNGVPVGEGAKSIFRFCISVAPGRQGEAYLTKARLEVALKTCLGDILVVCNSCFSGALNSPRWKLICAAGPDEYADALQTSSSGNVRGSVFGLCALAEVGHAQGVVIPVPRSEKRPAKTALKTMLKLPAAHSFTSTSRPLLTPSSSTVLSMPAFVRGMQERQRTLIYPAGHRFRHHGFGDTESRPWRELLPMVLSQSLVDEVTISPDVAMAQTLNQIYQHGSSSTITSSRGLTPSQVAHGHLLRLAPLFSPMPKCMHLDKRDAQYCERFLRDPQSLMVGEVVDFAEPSSRNSSP
ncbi:hypothetical protein C8J57DRAFT_1571513 [Mycena rebaudengoi]|nr:hypothetical protein C8J57DRAFT_1571513 [Mycena rebaudengoi]